MFNGKSYIAPSFTRTLNDLEVIVGCKLFCFLLCLQFTRLDPCFHKGTCAQDKKTQAAPASHLPVVNPPPAWPHPSVGGSWADPAVIDNFKRQIDQLNSQLANNSAENDKLKAEVISLQSESDSTHDVESTLIPSQVVKTSNSVTVQQSG